MSGYYILPISGVKNTFSLIEAGTEFLYAYHYREDEESFESIEIGDKILGFLRNPIEEIRYNFIVHEIVDSSRIISEKNFEVSKGVSLNSLDEKIITQIEENVGEIIRITEYQYNDIVNLIFSDNIIDSEDSEEKNKECELEEFNLNKEITTDKLSLPYNYIVFGAPGTGKSNTLKEAQESYFKNVEEFERVTFYPNYSYQNFVGTYKPKMNGKDIVYEYIPGPFIRTLIKAYKHPDKNFLLLIEEINRANPAAVFGDVFQLLDRKEGKSEYEIETSEDLKEFLAVQLIPGYSECDNAESRIKALNSLSKIFIPSNMYIWATMNSADQGVFQMDTAFKRRWNFKYIGINENSSDMESVEVVLGSGDEEREVNWNKLRVAINNKLSKTCKVNEDKLIGPYFLSKDIIEQDEGTSLVKDNGKFIEAFQSKVLMYLYEDAAKQHKQKIFEGCEDYSKYSSVCESFEKFGEGIFGKDIVDALKEEE